MDLETSITLDADFNLQIDIKDTTNLIFSVYDSVVDEYSSWSTTNTRFQLTSLSRSNEHTHRKIPEVLSHQHNVAQQGGFSSEDPFVFDFVDLNPDSGSINTYTFKSTIVEAPEVMQHAGYDICTPSFKNLMIGDDPDNLSFLPFADDPNYDYDHELWEYKYLSWDWFIQPADPDIEVILIDTMRRLQGENRLTREVIDQSQALSMTTAAIVNCSHRRDPPKWRDSRDLKPLSKSDPVENPSPMPTTKSPREMLDYFITNFCNHLNCVTGFCFTHTSDAHLPLPNAPTIPHSKLNDQLYQACGAECVLNPPSALASIWTDEDCELLSIILETSPDVPSCDIAPILKKPCRDVHKYRQQCMISNDLRRPMQSKLQKKAVDSDTCHNVAIQRNKFKATDVRQSKYGLGLFVLEDCLPRELISEYIGEIIFEPTVRSRHPHTVHTGRCYVFGLATGTCLDSALAGNESRFINHSSTPNCESRLVLVNGQHRIGIYAARFIKAGEELFIHYGSEFPIEGSSMTDAPIPDRENHSGDKDMDVRNPIVGDWMDMDYDRFSDDTYRPSSVAGD
ncbi:hypothetical protein BJ165DRAFT_1520451 [Panaeolus papilionaceus]|nr:hypothetical protein BJ165DRAFT_1520451 [Panaeolus papilionaceus]